MKQKFTNLLIAVTLPFLLTSCITAALASMAGGGAYFLGKANSQRSAQTIKTQSLMKAKEELKQQQSAISSKDTGINSEINSRLISGSATPEMAVYPEVKNGVVILHGRVPDPATAERIIATARNTPGVERIISNLVIVNQQQQSAMPFGQQPQQQNAPQQFQQQYMPPQQVAPIPMQQQQFQRPQQFQQQYIPPQSNLGNGYPDINNTAKNLSSGAKKKSQNIDHNKPKTMTQEQINQYMDNYADNDSGYVKYNPNKLRAPQVQPSQQQFLTPREQFLKSQGVNVANPTITNPYTINVPAAYQDNDSVYRPFTGYNVNNKVNSNLPVQPSAPSYQDNDAAYDLIYYY